MVLNQSFHKKENDPDCPIVFYITIILCHSIWAKKKSGLLFGQVLVAVGLLCQYWIYIMMTNAH